MKAEKRTMILTTLVCLLPLITGALVYNKLPESVPVHFDFNGEPNGWAGRAVAAFGLPSLMLAINLFLPFALNADPKRQNMSEALKNVVIWTIPVLSVICSGATLAKGLGYDVKIEVILPVFMGLLFVIIGNYLPKTKQSYTMGIKLPWTLNSEENWNRTHRLAGFLWVVGGLIFIAMSFIGWTLPVFLIVLAVMTLVPIGYSYMLYKKGI
ncbi:MAG: SdpI family protein [Oscillospiraceae bacterium]|nr:SdpI family protein [Oscillospiraceae bacterium]